MEFGDERALENQDVDSARKGDQQAFQTLVERHARPIYRLAWRITGNGVDAEDVVQEAFMRAWKQLARFDGRASFGTWLHRICTNCALDHVRARQRRQDSSLPPPRDEAQPDPFLNVAHEGPSPERLAQSAQITAILLPALDGLTEMERTAFVLRHYEGLPIQEISRTLGVEMGAAKHSVFRAVQKLRRALEPALR